MQDQKKGQSTGSTESKTGGTEEETAPTGKQGQHWRGEDMPLERTGRTEKERQQPTGREGESSAATSDRPDEC